MNILVVTGRLPFIYGGNEILCQQLVERLKLAGHKADLLYIPVNRFGSYLGNYISARMTDVGLTGYDEPVDLVISMRFPSYCVRHPNHVCWLNHRIREYYDLWEQFYASLPNHYSRIKERIRRAGFWRLDSYFLRRVRLLAQSRYIAARLKRWGRFDAEVLYPPPLVQPTTQAIEYGDYILSVGRLTTLKRIDLLLAAYARLEEPRVDLVIAGDGEQRKTLQKQADKLGISHKVNFIGSVDKDKLVELYSNALAVYYGARLEDMGLVPLEAFAFAKPVITLTDSGAPTELVIEGKTGAVAMPDPQSISEALARIVSDSRLAGSMGNAGRESIRQFTWQRVIATLLA